MTPTPQMLNWLCRYAPVSALALDEAGRLQTSLLDVGSGPHGLACAAPGVEFVGMDMDFPLPATPAMVAIRNEPGPFPFADAAFGTVVSLDVLEHVPPADRRDVVLEMTRVSAHRVIVACPSSEMAALDNLVRGMFRGAGQPVPGWLSEHDENGLPTPEEIDAICAPPAGFARRDLELPNGLLSTMATIADFLGHTAARASAEATHAAADWVNLFQTASFGDSWRKGYVLERVSPVEPLVDLRDLEATTVAALRCQACRAPFDRPEPDLLVCTGCGQHAPRNAQRAFDLRAGAPPAVRRTFWCEPTWRVESLAPLLHRFADLGDPSATLVLRAEPGTITGEEALALAGQALGGRSLPEQVDVVILADELTPERVRELRAGAMVMAEHELDRLPAQAA